MGISTTDITGRFPEFANVETSTIQLAINDAALSVNRDVFGVKADLATIYMAAHLLALSSPSNSKAGGRITSEKVGDLARTYAGGSEIGKSDPLAETKYGIEFLRIRRSVVTSPCVITQSGSLDR